MLDKPHILSLFFNSFNQFNHQHTAFSILQLIVTVIINIFVMCETSTNSCSTGICVWFLWIWVSQQRKKPRLSFKIDLKDLHVSNNYIHKVEALILRNSDLFACKDT